MDRVPAKRLHFGLTLAVLADATLVRLVLVPAFMQVMGKWNWWAPKPMSRLHNRLGISDGHVVRRSESTRPSEGEPTSAAAVTDRG